MGWLNLFKRVANGETPHLIIYYGKWVYFSNSAIRYMKWFPGWLVNRLQVRCSPPFNTLIGREKTPGFSIFPWRILSAKEGESQRGLAGKAHCYVCFAHKDVKIQWATWVVQDSMGRNGIFKQLFKPLLQARFPLSAKFNFHLDTK